MLFNNERPTGQKQQLFDGKTVESKGKIILYERCEISYRNSSDRLVIYSFVELHINTLPFDRIKLNYV